MMLGIKWIYEIRKNYRSQSIHTKVRITFIVFSVIPLFVLLSILFFHMYHKNAQDMYHEMEREMEGRYYEMRDTMNNIEFVARTVWSDTAFLTEVGKAAIDNNIKEYDRYIFKEYTLSTLKAISNIGKVQGARIYLDCPKMKEYYAYLYNMKKAKLTRWYDDRDALTYKGAWYMDVFIEVNNEVYSNFLTEKNMASFIMPVHIGNDLSGVFETVVPMEILVADLFEERRNKEVFLMDNMGLFYGIRQQAEIGNITNEMLLEILEISQFQDLEDEKVYIRNRIINFCPIMIGAVRDNKTGFIMFQVNIVKEQYLNKLITLAGILVVEILLTWLLMNTINHIITRLLRDFDILSACIKEVEKGNLYVEIPKFEQKEINEIALEYTRMLEEIRVLIEENVKREVMVKEAQLNSLEKQIDSHFLYNVLDSIKMMAEVRQIYSVSDALLALSRMFRYNLQMNRNEVYLKDEIMYMKSYLALCNIRYEYNIGYCENVEDVLLDISVPKVILQPIVENAIMYGLDELAEDTTIYLKAYRKNNDTYIEITDMGKGIDEKRLVIIKRKIQYGEDMNEEKVGVALRNIHERIQLLYGEEYGVEIYSKEGCYTKVAIKLPQEISYE